MGSWVNIRVECKKKSRKPRLDGLLHCLLLLKRCHTVSSPTSLEKKLCQIAYSFKCKAPWRHYDSFSFSPLSWSLPPSLLTLDTFSPHFTLKKHLHIWVVLARPQKNKSGNKDTKWPRKMAKKWALQSDHLGGQGNPSVFFRSICEPKFCQFRFVGSNIQTLLV